MKRRYLTDTDRGLLQSLYERHAEEVRDLIFFKTGLPETAEDLMQDAFVKLAGQIERGMTDNPRARLFDPDPSRGIISGLVVDFWRAGGCELPKAPEEIEDIVDSGRGTLMFPPLQPTGFPDAFDGALRELGEPERDAFILTDLRGLSEQAAGALVGVSQPTISRRRTAAITSIREELL
jgi:DNA-directed RNA polymerase specialized sigma24 family protein